MLKHIAVGSRANPSLSFLQSLHRLLQSCSSMEQLKQLHAQLIANGLLGETLAVAPLVAFCSVSGSGDLRHGREIFERVPDPNRFMWNSLIRGYSNSDRPTESLLLHRRMLGRGLLPNDFTLPFVLKSCAILSELTVALLVHAMVFKLGFESQVFVLNALLHAYTSCRSIRSAQRVFDDMPHRNVVSWNSMIGGYSQSGDCEMAFAMFRAMRDSGLKLDRFTLVNLLSLCSQMGNSDLGRIIHLYMVVSGVSTNMIVWNALLDMYGKCGELGLAQTCFDRMAERNVVSWTSMVCAYAKQGLIDLARCWFDRMPERSIVSWNAMISCYVRKGLGREGLILYAHMLDSGIVPDEVTLATTLSACGQTGDLIIGKKTHDYICNYVANPSITLLNSAVDMYAKCGPIDIALDLFSTMSRKNVVSWNAIIGALAMHGRASDAVELFKTMMDEGFSPDGITFTGLLCACSHGGLLEVGRYYFEAMSLVYKVCHEIEHYACMVDLLGRGGHLGEAVELIRRMPMKPDVVIWGALLGACRIHGNVAIGEQVMKQLLELEQYSGGLYVLISNMYCETRRWEETKKLRKLMKERGIKKGRATSLIEIHGRVHEFVIEDIRHEDSHDIYLLLDGLTDHLMTCRVPSDTSGALMDEEEVRMINAV